MATSMSEELKEPRNCNEVKTSAADKYLEQLFSKVCNHLEKDQ